MLRVIYLLLSISLVSAQARTDAMNGIKLSMYPQFHEKWKIVTFRMRQETGEMRVIYANPLAYKTLSAGSINYPDGAVIAKIAFKAGEDPAFPSSLEPSGTRRFQFMVRDKTRYKSTNGWGYALFDSDGKTYPEDLNDMQKACAACHQLVENRGHVFARPWIVDPAKKHRPPGPDQILAPTFVSIKIKDLPEKIRKQVPAKIVEVQSLTGVLQEKLFQGTLDEVRPILSREVIKTGKPALLFNPKSQRFSLVYKNSEASCASGEVGLTSIMSRHYNGQEAEKAQDSVTHFCFRELGE